MKLRDGVFRALGWLPPAALALALLADWQPAEARERERVVVVAGPAKGPYHEFTRAISAGVALAKEAADGRRRDGDPVTRIVAVDDGCDADWAKQVADLAALLGASAVIGHPCAGVALAAAPIYAARGIVFIAPATTHVRLTAPGAAPVLRLAGRDDMQGRVAGRYLLEAFGGQPVALLSDKTVAGRALVDAARAELAAGGRGPVVLGHVTAGENDYAPIVRRLAGARVAAVYFTGGSAEAATIARQLHGAGLGTRLLVAEAAAEPTLWRSAGTAADGIMALLPPDPKAIPMAAEQVAILSKSGVSRLLVALHAHAAFEVWWSAALAAPDGRPRLDDIRAGTFATVIGPVSFAANGDARVPSYSVHEHKGGRLEQVWSAWGWRE